MFIIYYKKIKELPSSYISTIYIRFRKVALLRWYYSFSYRLVCKIYNLPLLKVVLRSVIATLTFAFHILLTLAPENIINIFTLLFKTGYIVSTASYKPLLFCMCRQSQVEKTQRDHTALLIYTFLSHTYFTTGFRNGLMISVPVLPHYS